VTFLHLFHVFPPFFSLTQNFLAKCFLTMGAGESSFLVTRPFPKLLRKITTIKKTAILERLQRAAARGSFHLGRFFLSPPHNFFLTPPTPFLSSQVMSSNFLSYIANSGYLLFSPHAIFLSLSLLLVLLPHLSRSPAPLASP